MIITVKIRAFIHYYINRKIKNINQNLINLKEIFLLDKIISSSNQSVKRWRISSSYKTSNINSHKDITAWKTLCCKQ